MKSLADDEARPSSKENDQDQNDSPSEQGLLFFKTLFFLEGFSANNFFRFGVIFFHEEKNLSLTQIGTIQGVTPFAALAAQVFWGWLADEIQSRQRVMVVCKFFCIALLLSLALPTVQSFTTIFLIATGISAFRTNTVLDAHTLDFLGPQHATKYGTIRLWSFVSSGFGAITVGQLADSYGSFLVDFGAYGFMMTLHLVAILFGLPKRSKSEQEIYDQMQSAKREDATEEEIDSLAQTLEANQVKPAKDPLSYGALKDTLFRTPVIVFLLEASVLGAGMSIVDCFLFMYMEKELQASNLLCGLTVGVAVLTALPIFRFSQELLEGLGHDGLLVLAMASFSSRTVGYAFLAPETVYWILLLQVLEGVTAACVSILMVDYADQIAPRGWSTTVQSTVHAIIFRIGGCIGPLLAGSAMDISGGRYVFFWLGVAVGLLCYVHVTAMLLCRLGHDKFLSRLQEEAKEDLRLAQLAS